MDMKSLCIAVPLQMAEDVRKALLEKGKLRKDLALEKDESFLYLPIQTENVEGEELGYMVSERDFQVLEKETKSYKEFIEIPDELMDLLPKSFDVVGQVAIVKLHDDIKEYSKNIGEALLKANKSIHTVALDKGVEGEERVRNLTIIAGLQSTETVHKEYGIELVTDPSKVYFSPRLATEHFRISQKVEDDETIIDMFCGIGPFPILIAKNRRPKKIYAIDINENAIDYLKMNIERNKVDNITPLHGDSKEIVSTLEPADRIIMNLPHSVFEFLPSAFSRIKNHGFIHYYEVLENEKRENRLDEINEVTKGKKIELVNLQEVHTYSPSSSLYCFDLKVEFDEGDI
jgi:tRNA (guanine37-N1)-methyltransferase